MRIGWIGLGKLGLPAALTMADAGNRVVGTDIDQKILEYIMTKAIPYQEQGVREMFDRGATVEWKRSIQDVCSESDIVFVAVQTPHAPAYEGVTPTPDTTRDFEYCYLREAMKAVTKAVRVPTVVAVVSTVLPGTMRRDILPITDKNPLVNIVYSPCFIAMGTASVDWRNPEMVLAGTTSQEAYNVLARAHGTMHKAPVVQMSIESAEMTKVLYNTYISMKIVWANTVMELAHKTGADCDEVVDALSLATKRIISPMYLRGGMGDGGGCHPRDNLALSHLARQHDLSVDLFDFLMRARDKQTYWLLEYAHGLAEVSGLPGRVCGREFKKGTNLTVGSPSRLLVNMSKGAEALWQDTEPTDPAVFIIGVNHDKYTAWNWPKGSIIVDPWGYIPDQEGVTVIRVGRK